MIKMNKKKTKLAQVVCTYPPYKGGIGNSAFKLAEFLSEKYEVNTFTPSYYFLKKNQAINENNKIHYCVSSLSKGKAGFLKGFFAKLKNFNTIIFHYPFFGADLQLAWFLIFKPKTKLILYYHMEAQLPSWKYKLLSLPSRLIKPFLFKKAHLIICSSLDYAKNQSLKKIYKKFSHKFQEIPFSVNTNEFIPNEKKSKQIKLLFVGGLDKAHYFKGLNVLFKALKELPTLNWQLEIVGEGELLEKYQKEVKKLKLENKISFKGKTSYEKLKESYQTSDIFILPSINKSEAFGLVLLEAMSSGLAVIASDLFGVRKVFNDKEQGLLFQTNNEKDLSEKIKYLLTHPEIRKTMSEKARKLAKEKYSEEKIKEKILHTI